MTCTIVSNGKELEGLSLPAQKKLEEKMTENLFHIIRDLLTEGCNVFFTNSERGIPLWAARMVQLFIEKHFFAEGNCIYQYVVAPYEEQAAGWSEWWREKYFRAHEHANVVAFISKQYQEGCYDEADKVMIDNSDILLVFGKPEDNLFAVKYAESCGKEVRFI